MSIAFATQLANWGKDSSRSGHVKRPWEQWELDESFFKSLSQWTLENPQKSLDRVLDNICEGLENHKDLFQLIPDSPFPARGLATALAHLFQLGVKISRAKKDVQEFAQDVIRWAGLVRLEFESPEDGYFTWRAWHNLKEMRDLIDEICLWAVDRLEDKRWSRVGHGLVIQKEVQEFRARVRDARGLFRDLSAISQAKGLDTILQNIRYLLQSQETIAVEINKIREAQAKQFDQILDELETRKEVEERERFFARYLDPHTVSNPTYDSHGKRPCDEGTRVKILYEILEWVNDNSPRSQNFLWLTGVPGSGKSAVTASFSRECKDRNILWAQYFITRNDAATTNPKKYFPTIARQLADYAPEVAKTIFDVLKETPSLTDDISAKQAAELFTKSIHRASELKPDQPVVVVIDGLDETDQDRLGDTARIFSTLFTSLEGLNNVKIFISSRTENEIQKAFTPFLSDEYVKHVFLDTADPVSIRDVSSYVERSLMDIVREHDLNWDVWPGDERLNVLKQRASGLFIWGVTAVKFIQGKIQDDGLEAISDVLDMLTADVLKDINDLYMRIIEITLGEHPSEWALERFRCIFGAILLWRKALRLDDLTALLDLREKPTGGRVDTIHFVRRFRTILVAGTDAVDGRTIPRVHKSVFEFFTGDKLDMKYRVEPKRNHLELGMQCLTRLGAAQEDVSRGALSQSFLYAFDSWLFHFQQANILGPGLVCADSRRLSSLPLSALFPKLVPLELPIVIRAKGWKIIAAVGNYERGWDAESGDRRLHGRIPVFSPDGRQVVFCLDDHRTILACDITYFPWTRMLAKYPSICQAIAYSPDGKTIACASRSDFVQLCDTSSALTYTAPRTGNDVTFSPNGEQIASVFGQICILWNASDGQPIGDPWIGHESEVVLFAFSGSGRRACSVDCKGYYLIWDVRTGTRVDGGSCGGWPTCVCFSPQNDDVIAIGSSQGVKIFSNHLKWSYMTEGVSSLRFAPDGKKIIFHTADTIIVAVIDEHKGSASLVADYNLPYQNHHSVFSPNLAHFADSEHIYTLHHNETSLDMVPLKGSAPPPQAYRDDGDQALMNALSKVEEIHHRSDAVARNRRLDAIRWYEAVEESPEILCVLTDDAVIAAYAGDGSVVVWNITVWVESQNNCL